MTENIIFFLPVASPPENVTVTCKFDNVSYASFVMVSWAPPLHPNGHIMHYNVSN